MWKILLEEFWGDLRTQKTRALLTMFAITWGTIAVVLLLSFGEGLKRAVVRGLNGAAAPMFMIYGGETSTPFEGLPRGRDVSLHEEDLDLLKRSIDEVEMVSVSYGHNQTKLKAGKISTTTMMEGVDPSFEELRRMYPAAGGRFLDPRDVAEKRRVVFLGDSISLLLFPDGKAVGRTLLLDGVPFTVVGTLKGKLQTSSNNGPDADRAIIPSSTFRTLYGPTRVSHLMVKPRDPARAEQVKARIYEVLGSRYKFDPKDKHAIDMWDIIEDGRTSRLIGQGIQIFLGVVGALTLLVAGVGVANIMYVVVRERTREIGIKLAVGARKRHIMQQFVFEALAIALTGGLIGLAFSAAVVYGVDNLPTQGNMAAEFLMHPRLSWPIALLTVGILAAIGLLAGLFPARKAASLDPVESLRYE
ncbi:MAG TPA: ABC transporter permease [Longimicrobiaceae bacterium]|jgi:putative ABC transport system permease protein|nr:ABC transporter permease [Longimicrobiaceae bacterium]